MSGSTFATTRSRPQTTSAVWTPDEDYRLTQIMERQTSVLSWCYLVASFPGKTAQQIAGRWENTLRPNLIKGSWTPEEDEKIREFVGRNGPRNWANLASTLPGRIGKQCRERWTHHLCPQVVKHEWTPEEELLVMDLHQQFGNQWTKIASFLPGRTDNCIKNRWHSTLKRRLERMAKGEPLMKKRGRKPKALTMSTGNTSDIESECVSPNEKNEFPPITAITDFEINVALSLPNQKKSLIRQENTLDVRLLMNRMRN
jgi:hypothetical protein